MQRLQTDFFTPEVMSHPPPFVRLPVELHLLIASSLDASDLYALIQTCRTLYESFIAALRYFALTNYGECADGFFNEWSALIWACRDPARMSLARSIFEYAHTKASFELKQHLFKPCHLRILAIAAAESGNMPILTLLFDEIENVSPEFCIKAGIPCTESACGCSCDHASDTSLLRRVFSHSWDPCWSAAGRGHIDVLSFLFERVYKDMNEVPRYSLVYLHQIALAGQVESLRLLLQAWNLRDSRFVTGGGYPHGALHTAALLGCLELAQFCLDEMGIPVDKLDYHDQTPLYYATEYLAKKRYTRCLAMQSPVLKRDKDGVKKVAELLVSRGAKVSSLSVAVKTKLPPVLHFFCQHESDLEMLEILLSAPELDCSARDEPHGLTPLHYAVQAGITTVVERLLAAGANANIPTLGQGVVHTADFMSPCLGRTPVHYAVVAARAPEKIQATSEELLSSCRAVLAAAGHPGVSARDSRGCTSLHLAAGAGLTGQASTASYQTGDNAPLLRLLLAFGAGTEINTKDSSGRTPLHHAAAQAAQDIEVLLSGCAGSVDLNARDNNGRTPLHFAASISVQNVEVLLSAGADPSAVDKSGRLPLHYVETKEAGAPAFFALLDASSDPSVDILLRDINGRTPLASFLERLDIVPLEPSNQIFALCRARGLPVELPQDEEGLVMGWYEMGEDGTLTWKGDGLHAIFSGGW